MPPEPSHIDIYVDEPGDFRSLHQWLRRTRGLTVEAVSALPAPGQQGSGWEFLSAAFASGGAGIAALQTLRAWLESRRSNLSVRVKVGDTEVGVTASNVREVMPILEKLLSEN